MKLIQGDCLEKLKELEDESVDLVVTDCPYKIIAGGIRIEYENDECSGILNKRQWSETDPKGVLNRGRIVKSDGIVCSNKWLKKGEFDIPSAVKQGKMFKHNDIEFKDWLPDVYRVLKKGCHCYIMINARNLKNLQVEAEKVGFEFQNLLVWQKNNATPNKYYMQNAEFILMLSKRPARNINNMGSKTVISIPNIIGKKQYPSEKPIELMRHLIENSSNVGDVVLDPFMGSGSTGVACVNTNRDFIGIELDEKYFEIAKARIKEAESNKPLL